MADLVGAVKVSLFFRDWLFRFHRSLAVSVRVKGFFSSMLLLSLCLRCECMLTASFFVPVPFLHVRNARFLAVSLQSGT